MRYLILLCALIGCGHTPPPPAPVPIVNDVFTSQVFDCHSTVVAVERDSAKVDARRCLLGQDTVDPDPAACLVKRASEYQPASVACAVRRLGADANAADLAGSANPDDKTIANAVRAWIRAEGLGYK